MIITQSSLAALRAGFKSEFQKALSEVPTMRDRVATTVRSTTGENTYGWLKKMTGMVEWIGARQVEGIAEAGYTIRNKHYEKTIGVNRNDIEDDNLGQYSMLFGEMADAAGSHPEKLVWDLLKAGFTTDCWDNQRFFDSDHPIKDENGQDTTWSNTGGGSGTPWFLLSTRGRIKPIILQERKPVTFTNKDRPEDDNVFTDNELIYGADWRGNVGYGVPQMAYGSKQTLNAAAYAAARAAMQGFKGDGGRPLGIVPDLLVVPPSLEAVGLEILNAERDTSGATNVWKGTAELLVVPWLA